METLVNVTIKLSASDWRKMGELYGKNRAQELRKAIKALIKIAEENRQWNKIVPF